MQSQPSAPQTKHLAHRAGQQHLKIVGHRGAAKLAVENTVASVMKALEYPVDEIEIDVRVTDDNVVVVHHDPAIRDANGAEYTIARHTYQKLLSLKDDLATLDEIIATIGRQIPLQIEVKPHEPVGPVANVVSAWLEAGWLASDFLIGSKDHTTLRTLHTALPEVPTVVIEPYLSIRAVWRARQLNTKRISMNRRGLWPGFISSMRRRGYQLYAYTLDDQEQANLWRGSGLAGVFTDDPSQYLKPVKPKRHA